jgi:GxxExxY protein
MQQGQRFPRKEETYRIIGACFEVYKEKGCGFLEPVYQECLDIELGLQDIPFKAQTPLSLEYKGHKLQHTYEPDFSCFGGIIVEIKAVSQLTDEHRAQLLNYMNAVRSEVGLLVNFGHHPLLEYERFVLGDGRFDSAKSSLRDSACSVGKLSSDE